MNIKLLQQFQWWVKSRQQRRWFEREAMWYVSVVRDMTKQQALEMHPDDVVYDNTGRVVLIVNHSDSTIFEALDLRPLEAVINRKVTLDTSLPNRAYLIIEPPPVKV